MTPGEITMATALIGLIKMIGSWPLSLVLPLLFVAVVLGPWGVVVLMSRAHARESAAALLRSTEHDMRTVELVDDIKDVFTAAIREQEKRFQAVSQMYENNVLLVKGYERLALDLTNIIHLNTQTNTKLVEKINNNHYCPVVRENSGSKNG